MRSWGGAPAHFLAGSLTPLAGFPGSRVVFLHAAADIGPIRFTRATNPGEHPAILLLNAGGGRGGVVAGGSGAGRQGMGEGGERAGAGAVLAAGGGVSGSCRGTGTVPGCSRSRASAITPCHAGRRRAPGCTLAATEAAAAG